MTPTDEQIRLAIAQQAADWFVANHGEGLDEAARGSFLVWLKTSPLHVGEYLRISAVARELRVAARDPAIPLQAWLAEARAPTSDQITSILSARAEPQPRARRVPFWLLPAPAMALVMVVLAGVLLWRIGSFDSGVHSFYTAHGEQRSWQLADGSSLQLNTDSAVRVRFSDSERVIEVTRGQAVFRVVHEAQRRFRVDVGANDVVAVGTEFEVYRQSQSATVTVLEGRVAVFDGHAPPTGGARLPQGTLTLRAGQQVRIDTGAIGLPQDINLRQSEAWLKGQIAFEQRPIGEVVAEFNRYAPIPLQVDDPGLSALPISGVLSVRDTDSFIAFLQSMPHIATQKTPTAIRVFRD